MSNFLYDMSIVKLPGFSYLYSYMTDTHIYFGGHLESFQLNSSSPIITFNTNLSIIKISKETKTIDDIIGLNLTQTSNGSVFNGRIDDFIVDNSNNIFIGGQFDTVNGIARNNLVKINGITKQVDLSFDTSIGFDNNVWHLVLDNSGNLFVAGMFSTYNGVNRIHLAKLNSTTAALDMTFDTSTGFVNSTSVNQLYAIAVDNANGLYVGGWFPGYKGVAYPNLVKINATTADLDTTFDTSDALDYNNDYIGYGNSLVLDNSNNLYIGGWFSSFKGVTRNNIVKVNATTAAVDMTFDPGPGADSDVESMALDNAGNLYITGYFEDYGALPGTSSVRLGLAKIDATTAALDLNFVPHTNDANGLNGVSSVAVDNSYVYVADVYSFWVYDKTTGANPENVPAIANIVIVGSTVVGAIAVDPTTTPILVNNQPLPVNSVLKNASTGQKYIKVEGGATAFVAIEVIPPTEWGWSQEGIDAWAVLQNL